MQPLGPVLATVVLLCDCCGCAAASVPLNDVAMVCFMASFIAALVALALLLEYETRVPS